MFNSVCCPLLVKFLTRSHISVEAEMRHNDLLIHRSYSLSVGFTSSSSFSSSCVLQSSELLQALDMCGNDPVAIARCFVDKVRGKSPPHVE